MPRKYSEIINHIKALGKVGYRRNDFEIRELVKESFKALYAEAEPEKEKAVAVVIPKFKRS